MKTAERQDRSKQRDAEGFVRIMDQLRLTIGNTVPRRCDAAGLDHETTQAIRDTVTVSVFRYFAPDLLGPGGIQSYIGTITDRVIKERREQRV